MKTVRFFFVMMIAVVLLPGTSLARLADLSSQQAASRSSDKSNRDQQRDVEGRDKNGQTHSGEIDPISRRLASSTKTATKRRSNTIHSQAASSHPRRPNKTPATSGARIDAASIVTAPQQTSLRTAVPVRNQAVSHRGLSAPSSAVSVNGQQFKNSRDPGGHLAISGGPITSARGTAAINGTNMKHKP
ncbi:MAG: hypothetical protein WAK27_05700 [Candidatus Sulfotelmatobacter sp.]